MYEHLCHFIQDAFIVLEVNPNNDTACTSNLETVTTYSNDHFFNRWT